MSETRVLHVHRRDRGPPAVAVVDASVRVRQHDREGEIMIEGELVEIDSVDVRDPHAHVVPRGLDELPWRTDQLPVENPAVYSGHTAKSDQERLALRRRLLARAVQVAQPRIEPCLSRGCRPTRGDREPRNESEGEDPQPFPV